MAWPVGSPSLSPRRDGLLRSDSCEQLLSLEGNPKPAAYLAPLLLQPQPCWAAAPPAFTAGPASPALFVYTVGLSACPPLGALLKTKNKAQPHEDLVSEHRDGSRTGEEKFLATVYTFIWSSQQSTYE